MGLQRAENRESELMQKEEHRDQVAGVSGVCVKAPEWGMHQTSVNNADGEELVYSTRRCLLWFCSRN